MTARFSTAIVFVCACIAGVLCGHAICSSEAGRARVASWFGRGKLLALAHGSGIYEQDVARALDQRTYRNDPRKFEQNVILSQLVADVALEHLSRNDEIPSATLERRYQILHGQFPDERNWLGALGTNGFSARSFRGEVAKHFRAESAIERRVSLATTDITADRSRDYYETHRTEFVQVRRFRASHLFLAAPPETEPEIVDAKKRAIEMISTRIAHGESFDELVQIVSEDEATKPRCGDLGFFSEWRMPPDFIAAIRNLRVGETSPIIRTTLGFHIVRLTDVKEARQMSYEEASSEIDLIWQNQIRRACVERLQVELGNNG